MLTLATAKTLLFVALSIGPKGADMIYATSPSENYVYSPSGSTWSIEAKAFPASDWTRNPAESTSVSTPISDVPSYLRGLSHHNWSHEPVMFLANGDRVEKRGDTVFYTYGPGQPNEKTFTFFFHEKDGK